jgi:hypothetical protein
MYVLLSSDYSPRYKQDILRCLASPVNASVQFRYDKVHVSDDVLNELIAGRCVGPALVCSVATKGVGALVLVPVRLVEIISARVHGSTTSLMFRTKEILNADAAVFTGEMDRLSKGESPRKKSEEATPEGRYFFEIERSPECLKKGSDLVLWEKTVTQLREQLAYKDEPFFLAVVGIQKQMETLDTTQLHPLPNSLSSGENFDIMVYHFQPRSGQRPNSKLELSVGPDIEIVVPPDTAVDSRYDLKLWNCRTKADSQTSQRSWFRIRVADGWELDIPISISGSWVKWVLRALVTGVLIAIPSVSAIVTQPLPVEQKYSLYAVAVLFGFLAGLVATFKIDRLD